MTDPNTVMRDFVPAAEYREAWDEISRLRELLAGQDDGGHWYSQASMDAVIRERNQLHDELAEWKLRALTAESMEDDAQQAAVKFRAERDKLRAALEASRIPHHICDDSWFSCPKSDDGEPDKQCECNCGADAHNARIDAALEVSNER